MIHPFLLFMGVQGKPAFDFDVRSGQGLTVSVQGVPVVRGSWFQYYEPNWTKGYYSSNWGTQKVRRIDADTVEMSFEGADRSARGTERFQRNGDRLTLRYHLEWNGEKPVNIEVTPGMIWAPAFEAGQLTLDGAPTRSLAPKMFANGTDLEPRRFGPDAHALNLESPLTEVDVRSSIPLTLFDGRGYRQDWAERSSLWWLGALALQAAPGRPVDFEVEWRFEPHALAAPREFSVTTNVAPVGKALLPDERVFPMVPRPKRSTLDFNKPIEVTNLFVFPVGRVRYWDLFKTSLARRFYMPVPAKTAKPISIDGGVSKLSITPGGYTIDISAKGVSLFGEEDEGLKNAMYRLARLVFAKGGKLWLPSGRLEDEPAVAFRGAHLFVGPQARPFQRKLWDRVLSPLGFNKVVLQCERADWTSTPLDPSIDPMPRAELASLFADYRARGIEPIPLIQSFGHMEWFFAGRKRLDLAVNPQQPYTIDPRKQGTRAALEALWKEAVDLLKPKTIHFGCDEVDMVGMPHDPALVTKMWQAQMPVLGEIAKRNGVSMMIWGDKALAPGEAPDAALGDDAENARLRRAAIPAGTTIADWHYKPDPRPEAFYPTLQLWKREGFRPIASTWYRPENIRGFDTAATLERVGTLQTTWAGYESSEAAMMQNLEQFTAFVLAADYSWSGRGDSVADLGYDPADVFRRLYFAPPSAVRSMPGSVIAWGTARTAKVGRYAFQVGEPIALRSILQRGAEAAPTSVNLSANVSAKQIVFAVDTARAVEEGEAVAEIVIKLAHGKSVLRKLVYGRDVRAPEDARLTPFGEREGGLCAVPVDLGGPSKVVGIAFRSLSTTTGLRIYAATAL
jgi:hypothetical protein